MAKTVLQEANALINGAREQEYGSALLGFTNIADQWKLYMFQKYGVSVKLTAQDVCFMMADLKKVRHMRNPKRDNIVDAAGYIGLVEKVGGGQ